MDVWVKGQVSGCATGRRVFEWRDGRVAVCLGREINVCVGGRRRNKRVLGYRHRQINTACWDTGGCLSGGVSG